MIHQLALATARQFKLVSKHCEFRIAAACTRFRRSAGQPLAYELATGHKAHGSHEAVVGAILILNLPSAVCATRTKRLVLATPNTRDWDKPRRPMASTL